MPIQATRMVSLSSDELKKVNADGGRVTFTPLSRKRFRCNQAPRLTRLSKKQVRLIRGQVNGYSANHSWPQPVSIKISESQSYPKARMDEEDDARCPRCSLWAFSVTHGVKQVCRSCGQTFIPSRF